MAEGRLAPAHFSQTEQYESAPLSGADFSLVERPKSRFYTRHLSNPRRRFARDANDLVNLDIYQQYLVDHPSATPLEIQPHQRQDWVNQHLYFHGSFYEQRDEEGYLRDRVLAEFRTIPYNQMIMRRDQEVKLHAENEEHIVPPDLESMRKTLEDFKELDRAGAAAIGRRAILIPESTVDLTGSGKYKNLSGDDYENALIFFDREMEEALEALKAPLVTPQRLITGVIKRAADWINSERLQCEATRRLDIDPVYYPMRLQKPGYYYTLGRKMLDGMNVVELPQIVEQEAVAA